MPISVSQELGGLPERELEKLKQEASLFLFRIQPLGQKPKGGNMTSSSPRAETMIWMFLFVML